MQVGAGANMIVSLIVWDDNAQVVFEAVPVADAVPKLAQARKRISPSHGTGFAAGLQ